MHIRSPFSQSSDYRKMTIEKVLKFVRVSKAILYCIWWNRKEFILYSGKNGIWSLDHPMSSISGAHISHFNFVLWNLVILEQQLYEQSITWRFNTNTHFLMMLQIVSVQSLYPQSFRQFLLLFCNFFCGIHNSKHTH